MALPTWTTEELAIMIFGIMFVNINAIHVYADLADTKLSYGVRISIRVQVPSLLTWLPLALKGTNFNCWLFCSFSTNAVIHWRFPAALKLEMTLNLTHFFEKKLDDIWSDFKATNTFNCIHIYVNLSPQTMTTGRQESLSEAWSQLLASHPMAATVTSS